MYKHLGNGRFRSEDDEIFSEDSSQLNVDSLFYGPNHNYAPE